MPMIEKWETILGSLYLMASHGLRFPEIRHSAKLPHAAAELKVTLQALAEMAGYGTSFAEVWPETPLESEKKLEQQS